MRAKFIDVCLQLLFFGMRFYSHNPVASSRRTSLRLPGKPGVPGSKLARKARERKLTLRG